MDKEKKNRKSALLPLKASHTEFVENEDNDDKLKELMMKLKRTEWFILTNKFAWFEMQFDSDFIDAEGFSSGEFFDIYAMQELIKEELMQSNRRAMQWQDSAILDAVPTD